MIRTIIDRTDPALPEMHLHDLPGEILLRIVEEPSFENLKDLCPAMIETRTILGLKDYPFAVGLDWDGTLNRDGYGFQDMKRPEQRRPLDTIYFSVGPSPVRIRDLGWNRTSRRLQEGLPIVTTSVEHGGVRYRQTAFAHSEDMSSARDMTVMVRWEIRNVSGKSAGYGLSAHADPGRDRLLKKWKGTLKPGRTETIYLEVFYEGSASIRPVPGKSPVTVTSLRASGRTRFERGHRQCTGFWTETLERGMTVTTPEARVNDAFRAWQAYNFLNTRRFAVGRRIVCLPHDGSGFYQDVFGITALSAVLALLGCGHFRDARRILEQIRIYQRRDGLLHRNYGACDNGLFVLSVARYCLYSGDRGGFLRLLPAARKSIRWALRNRNRSAQADQPAADGLIRCKYTADIPAQDYCYLNDAYNWKGLHEMCAALARAGLTQESLRLRKEADSYRRDILASMKAASFPERKLFEPGAEYKEFSFAWKDRGISERGDLTVVPMTPLSRSLERAGMGGYYYAIVAGQVLETEILDLRDQLCRTILRYMEQRGAFLLGLVRWYDSVGIDHAYSYGYLSSKLREGKVAAVLLGFYAMLAYGMDRDTYAGTEIVDLVSGRPCYGGETVEWKRNRPRFRTGRFHYQPHTYSNTQQIRLLQMMLAREEGETLLLGDAVPRSWTENLDVKNVATRWGAVSFSVRRTGIRETRAVVETRFCSGQSPGAVHLRVRDPGKRRIETVTVNGKPWENCEPSEGIVVLPPRMARAEILIRYETRARAA